MKYSWIVYSILHVLQSQFFTHFIIYFVVQMFLLLPPIIYIFHLKNIIEAKRKHNFLIFISDDNSHSQCIIPVAIKLGIFRNQTEIAHKL